MTSLLALTLCACSLTVGPQNPGASPTPVKPSASPSASPTPVAGECPSAAVDTSGWQNVNESGFSFKLPPAFHKLQVQGIDSLVGKWAASETRFVSYDYGGFSSTLDEAKDVLRDYAECRISTGSLRARVVSGFDAGGTWESEKPKYVVAAAWRDIKPGLHLSMTTTATQADQAAELYAILRSVRFN
ncbi:MAG: hypothetical protein ACAI44_40640 [Candidatus Sericytochromatia bacterium]